jgi:hypothetical protein
MRHQMILVRSTPTRIFTILNELKILLGKKS